LKEKRQESSRMSKSVNGGERRRGRPSKFGRPSRVVAFTLPEDVIDRLRRVHRDLGWAIVKVMDSQSGSRPVREESPPDIELVTVADRRALIVINNPLIRHLPGVNIIPLSGTRSFLALDIDRGLSDLELAVSDRLADTDLSPQERRALTDFQSQLRAWRHAQDLRFHTRAIIVVERVGGRMKRAARPTVSARQTARRALLNEPPEGPG
jgi:hypothetical protein